MIYIASALKQKEIIELLENIEGDSSYKFIEKKGIKLAFEVGGVDDSEAVNVVKSAIKATDFGKALYFQVTV